MNGFSQVLRDARVRLLLLSIVLLLSACSWNGSRTRETAGQRGDSLFDHDWAKLGLASVEGPDGRPILSYDVTKCHLTFELEKDSPDVWAQLDVSYYVWAGSKSAGFSPVGENKVENLTCVDETGKRLPAEVKRGSGKYLVWYFPEVTNGCKSVTVRFRLLDVVQRYGDRMVLDVPWADSWPVPVHNSQVGVVFPAGVRPDILRVCPEKHNFELLENANPAERDWRHGKIVVRQTQMPLTDNRFLLEYRER